MGESLERRTISSGRANRPRVLPRRPSRDLAPLRPDGIFFSRNVPSVRDPFRIQVPCAPLGPGAAQAILKSKDFSSATTMMCQGFATMRDRCWCDARP
jgi:hypothetical protein